MIKVHSATFGGDIRWNNGVLEIKRRIWGRNGEYIDRWMPVPQAGDEHAWRQEIELYTQEHWERAIQETRAEQDAEQERQYACWDE